MPPGSSSTVHFPVAPRIASAHAVLPSVSPREAVADGLQDEAARRGQLPFGEAAGVLRQRGDRRIEVGDVGEVDVGALTLEPDHALLVDVVLLELAGHLKEQVVRMLGIDRERPQVEAEVIAGRRTVERTRQHRRNVEEPVLGCEDRARQGEGREEYAEQKPSHKSSDVRGCEIRSSVSRLRSPGVTAMETLGSSGVEGAAGSRPRSGDRTATVPSG